MIVNVYSVLAGSVGMLRLAVAGVLLALAWLVWRQCRRAGSEQVGAVQDRVYLVFLLAFFLTGLNLASWPLLYMVLQSYVPEWPGVTCIYGVTRIGLGSDGISRHLPALLQTLQVLKPALVFLAGIWLVLYAAHRRSETAWLVRPLLITLLVIGAGSTADAAVEGAYLVIPKRNEFLASGCCTVPDAAFTTAGVGTTGMPPAPWLFAAYAVAHLGIILGLRRYRARCETGGAPSLAPYLAAAGATAVVSALFLNRALAPRVLGSLEHYCAYDFIPNAPHVVLGVALFAWGSFSIGWAAAARRLAVTPEGGGVIPPVLCGVLRAGERGYLYSMVVIACALLFSNG
jgi:hypothetical protein